MKILQICHKVPWPPYDGGSVAPNSVANGLINLGIDLKILAMNPSRDPTNLDDVPENFITKGRLEAINIDNRIKPFDAIKSLFENKSYLVKRFDGESFKIALTQILQKEVFDIVQLEHSYLATYIDTIRSYSKAKVILRPQNVEHQVWQKVLLGMKNPAYHLFLSKAIRKLELFEKNAAGKVDGIIAISKGDELEFRKYAPIIPVVNIPVGFDFRRLNNYDFERQYRAFPSVYHLGSMDWRPNAEAIEWFVKEIAPALARDLSGLSIHLAGKKMPARFFKTGLSNLKVEGTVPDAIKYQEDKTILVVPLLSGGGIRAKIIEAMALGKTIITTSTGIKGINCTDGKEAIIANSAREIIEAIKTAANSVDLCREMGVAARNFAKKHFGQEMCAGDMIRFYSEIAGK